ncbi:hypothetical protein HDV62DRAFT_389607 [Trichoderma sp. SZMC 28011]
MYQLYSLRPMDGHWTPYDDGYEHPAVDSDMFIGQAYPTDEVTPILDWKYSHLVPTEHGDYLDYDDQADHSKMSGSSFIMPTSGALSDISSYESFSAALSKALAFSSDYPPASNQGSSPVASLRMKPQHLSESVQTQRGGRASPLLQSGLRSAPYGIESSRNKRWPTRSYSKASSQRHLEYKTESLLCLL